MDGMTIARDARVLLGSVEIGRVTHVVVDARTKEVTEVVVAHDGRESTIPIGEVADAGGGTVRLRDADGARLRGDFVRDEFRSIDDRAAEAGAAGVAQHGGAPLRAAEDDAVTIGRVAPSAVAPPSVDRGPRPQSTRATATGDGLTVPVAEERLTVGTREVERGAVEIRTTVTEERRTVGVTLGRDEVTVREVDTADRPLRAGEAAFEEGVITIPVRGEEAVVAKEAVVTGEVVIGKERVAEERQITDTVRREQVEVERTEISQPGRGARHDDAR